MYLFSATLDYFAAVTEDNRLKVWDVSSGALEHDLKERDHLSYKYTSIAWTQKSPLLKSSGKRAKAGAASSAGLIALGTSTGTVVVWDLHKAEVVQRLASDKEGHGAAIHDVAFNSQGNLLYSHAAGDKYVLEWNVVDAAVARKLRGGDSSSSSLKLAVSPEDDTLAAGGTAIKTVDLSSGKKARKLVAGLSSAVHALAFSPCKRFLFSSTVGGRFVNMYDLARLDLDEPVVTFSLPSPAASLSVRSATSTKKKTDVVLAAVSTTGALFVWRRKYKSGDKSTKPVAPDAASRVAGTTASNDNGAGILLAQHAVGSDDDTTALVVVRGSTAKPVFETVALVDAQQQPLTALEFAPLSAHALVREAASKKHKTSSDETTHVPALAERSGLANAKDVVDATAFEELAGGGDEDGDEQQLSLAERVEALRERVESDLAAELARADAATSVGGGGSGPTDRPDASSLSTLLEQALQSKDNAMLEYCLRTRDAKVIGATIKRVASVKVLELLEILVLKLEKSPARCARLCPWVRSILLHHTAYLMTQPDLVPSLSALYQLLENRLAVHAALQRLSGRLSLVIGQIHEAQAEHDGEGGPRAKIVFNEEDETDRAEDDEEQDEEDDDEEEEEDDDAALANGHDEDDDDDDAMDSDDDDE